MDINNLLTQVVCLKCLTDVTLMRTEEEPDSKTNYQIHP